MTQHATSSTRLAWRLSFAPRRMGGLTAIELMVTVAIMSVLMALAAPSFTPLIEGWRVRQATEQLQSTLYYARSEAIKRGGQVVVQKLPDGTNGCSSATSTTDWDCGWFVCHDLNNNGRCNSTDPVLQRYDTPGQIQVTRKTVPSSDTIRLNRWGLVASSWPGFSLVPYGESTANHSARGVCMSSGGRVRIIPNPPCPD